MQAGSNVSRCALPAGFAAAWPNLTELLVHGLRWVLESVLHSVKVLETHVLPESTDVSVKVTEGRDELSDARSNHKEAVWGIANAVRAAAEARRVEAELLRAAEEVCASTTAPAFHCQATTASQRVAAIPPTALRQSPSSANSVPLTLIGP